MSSSVVYALQLTDHLQTASPSAQALPAIASTCKELYGPNNLVQPFWHMQLCKYASLYIAKAALGHCLPQLHVAWLGVVML